MDIAELKATAEAGSTVAQSVLGIAYLEWLGVKREFSQAFRWLTAASEKGASRALVYLGSMCERGLEVSADPYQARELYEAGAERGEFFGCVFLARIFAQGRCGGADTASALGWYREAAAMRGSVEECPGLAEALSYVSAHGNATA